MAQPRDGEPFVSTGALPPPDVVRALVAEAHSRFKRMDSGTVSQVYPALAQVAPELFGVAVVSARGRIYEAGEVDVPFTLMSVAKPFTFAVVCGELGAAAARKRIGMNATGLPFNSAQAIERSPDGRTNPMVNAGAIVTASLVPGVGEEKWERILASLSAFAGRQLAVDEKMLESVRATNHTNRALAFLLHERRLLGCEPDFALELYSRQSSVQVTAHDLAVMGATLGDGGVNPITKEQVVSADACMHTLAAMITAGMYEASGDWLYHVGHPGKSGISGAIVTAAPGKAGLAVYSPAIDGVGNSVRGQAVATFLARELGLHLLQSVPAG
ncbi:MAG TPA: glutaminase A [Actinomycetaceae bacterium]|nr:glutaminase A [Terrimesophilobacter sp.]HZK06040.1 glutaminase A [Actinomycetaceae bacterium]